MSLVSLDNLSPQDLIAQYILEIRGKGAFLGYAEHALIQEWISAATDVDDVLLILSELLPDAVEKKKDSRHPGSIKGLHKKVMKKLKEKALLKPSGS